MRDGQLLEPATNVTSERRRYETAPRIILGPVAAPFTLDLELREDGGDPT